MGTERGSGRTHRQVADLGQQDVFLVHIPQMVGHVRVIMRRVHGYTEWCQVRVVQRPDDVRRLRGLTDGTRIVPDHACLDYGGWSKATREAWDELAASDRRRTT